MVIKIVLCLPLCIKFIQEICQLWGRRSREKRRRRRGRLLATPSRSDFSLLFIFACVFFFAFFVYFGIISLMVFKFYDLVNKCVCSAACVVCRQASIDKAKENKKNH